MLYLAADHRGYELKEKLKTWLTEWGVEYHDLGAHALDGEDDYPDFIHTAAQMVSENPTKHRAIVMGGSGQGEAMVANRHPGVRAMVYYGGPTDLIAISRIHNNCNVLSLAAAPGITIAESQAMNDDDAKKAIQLFLDTKFPGEERHIRRINKIDLT